MHHLPIARRDLIAGAAALALVRPARAAPRTADPVVTAPAGRWRGTTEAGVHVFRGIRYGVDPTRFRFQPVTAPAPSRDTLAATDFGPSCPQRANIDDQNEDCLFLNVWTPDARRGANRPVMVYFHGGAYTTGTVVDPLVYGHKLAADGDVVVVTVNHRLNALGYLYLARLDPRFPDSGNVGQRDQLLALRWIRDNIATFGGDPSRVMLFGQSGGGAKIATLLAMPDATGLFHAAATMSGQQVTASGPLNATRRAQAFLARLKATPAEAATLPIARLVDALAAEDPILGGGVYMGPVLDMRSLQRHPFWPDAHPLGRHIPLILGNTREETRAFIAPQPDLHWTNLAERIAPQLRVDAPPEWVVAQYRAQFPAMTPEDILYRATTAGRSWPGQVIEAEARAAAGSPAWVYQLDYASPVRPGGRAAHTDDIPLVFGTLDAPGSMSGTGPAARALSQRMMAAFVSLATHGNPGRDWRHHTLPTRATMVFDTTSQAVNDPRRWERELFARFPYIQPGT
ncbi:MULTISPECIES: carboxylesterase/lipase family protein [Sphingomonas]|jgi:para-nitrobenzyl esterase|uniref:Carboxylic ester hydrolase n=1 Tax=Sphingomonas hankookensis TaxID=563996 RepID=A0ABR5YES9_9SPHN|nr:MULTISPECIES: carboxylesterase family protein [Sphingomonas]KZE17097.1 carboxylesterase [Sphingomonas hankookensis]PZT92291.1 MAG: carboxylesterase/lipase family protein [Sphingomonas sp.]RSV25750.1 carboxylesterase/lipase family protein [Sphingomonas sp. ABOLH]WCP71764.1 carboxylesterase family protein [Sphingomonas hankookensis]